jgi:hypothetical protein
MLGRILQSRGDLRHSVVRWLIFNLPHVNRYGLLEHRARGARGPVHAPCVWILLRA